MMALIPKNEQLAKEKEYEDALEAVFLGHGVNYI